LSAQLQAHEKRRLKRFSVRLKVYSQQTDELIGYAENLHSDGMMIAYLFGLAQRKKKKD